MTTNTDYTQVLHEEQVTDRDGLVGVGIANTLANAQALAAEQNTENPVYVWVNYRVIGRNYQAIAIFDRPTL